MTAPLSLLRRAFPALGPDLCFLDWGATGLLSEPARLAVSEYMDELARCPSGDATWMHARHGATRQEARRLIAGLLNADANDVGLVENTTAGLNAAASAIRLQEGDNIVLSALDYLAVATPWKHRQRRDKIELRFVPPRGARIEVADLLDRIDARTRVIAISTVTWTTGALLDLEALAQEARMRGILLVVDAIQTFGVAPIDVKKTPVSFLAVGGHKWLASTLGAGFLYVHPLIAARHQPPYLGFLSGRPPRGTWADWFSDPQSSAEEEVAFPNSGRSYESGGTPSYVGALGVLEMAKLLTAATIPAIAEHVRDLGDRLITGLDRLHLEVVSPRERVRRAGLVVFRLTPGVDAERELVVRLRERRIVVSQRYARGVGGIRVSLHGMNTEADVEALLAALA